MRQQLPLISTEGEYNQGQLAKYWHQKKRKQISYRCTYWPRRNNKLHDQTTEFKDRDSQSWYGQNNHILLKPNLDNTEKPFYILKLY